jgi:hypothetical protein
MSGSFLERLSRFTPDAGRLDRDALLFAAGRGSARPNRLWITLTAVLAGTQALSLALLWPHAAPPAGGPVQIATAPPSPAVAPPLSETETGPNLWLVRQSLLNSPAEEHSPGTTTSIVSDPPLRAFAPPPSSILY